MSHNTPHPLSTAQTALTDMLSKAAFDRQHPWSEHRRVFRRLAYWHEPWWRTRRGRVILPALLLLPVIFPIAGFVLPTSVMGVIQLALSIPIYALFIWWYFHPRTTEPCPWISESMVKFVRDQWVRQSVSLMVMPNARMPAPWRPSGRLRFRSTNPRWTLRDAQRAGFHWPREDLRRAWGKGRRSAHEIFSMTMNFQDRFWLLIHLSHPQVLLNWIIGGLNTRAAQTVCLTDDERACLELAKEEAEIPDVANTHAAIMLLALVWRTRNDHHSSHAAQLVVAIWNWLQDDPEAPIQYMVWLAALHLFLTPDEQYGAALDLLETTILSTETA
jgi:hypothetical protein